MRAGGIHQYLEKIFDCIALNILWLLCCLPVITIGAATTALYYTAVKVLKMERGSVPAEFFRAFKQNFFKAAALWIFFALLLIIAGINRNIAGDIQNSYTALFFVCLYTALGILVFAVMIHSFAALSRFEMDIFWIVKIALYMTVRYFYRTLALLVMLGAACAAVYYLPLLVLALPAPAVIAASFFIERSLVRHTPKPENDKDAESKWYLQTTAKHN